MGVREDGGPAFPAPKSSLMRDHAREPHRFTHDIKSEGGMSLRDWFAGQALAGMLALGSTPGGIPFKAGGWDYPFAAFKIADDMLAERSK